MTLIFLLQLVLPLLFIGGIGFAPPKSTLAFFTQTVGTSAALLALALTGLWLFSALVDAVCIRWFVGGRSFPWLAAMRPVRHALAFGLDALDAAERAELLASLDEAEREIDAGHGTTADELRQAVSTWAGR